jgi:hypothetical protein
MKISRLTKSAIALVGVVVFAFGMWYFLWSSPAVHSSPRSASELATTLPLATSSNPLRARGGDAVAVMMSVLPMENVKLPGENASQVRAKLQEVASEAVGVYTGGSRDRVFAYLVSQGVERHPSWADAALMDQMDELTKWFTGSVAMTDGEVEINPVIVAGTEIRYPEVPNVNTVRSRRTHGTTAMNVPPKDRYVYEVKVPCRCTLPRGNEIFVQVGLEFQWNPNERRWQQIGGCIYGIPSDSGAFVPSWPM